MVMKNFKVVATLDSDTGKHKLNFEVCVLHEDIKLSWVTEQAVKMICTAEGCPESAIKDLKISRTKD